MLHILTGIYFVNIISVPGDNAEHSRVIIHIDIDCFYAQVEMLRNPSLRDKPLGKFLNVCNVVTKHIMYVSIIASQHEILTPRAHDLTLFQGSTFVIACAY